MKHLTIKKEKFIEWVLFQNDAKGGSFEKVLSIDIASLLSTILKRGTYTTYEGEQITAFFNRELAYVTYKSLEKAWKQSWNRNEERWLETFDV